MHPDGAGLYLQVTQAGVPSWIFRYSVGGKRERAMGLGPLHTITLKRAREKAAQCREQRLDGIDPLEARKTARIEAAVASARTMTFRQCAEAYIAAHGDSWTNPKHAKQWRTTIETYAYPILGDLPVQAIDVDLVVRVLEPIWKTKNETASRLRGRLENILSWASVRKFRQGDNPARWRGHLEELFAKRSAAVHHAALPYRDLPDFVAALGGREGIAARALEFTILTACRSGEVLGARWSEIDMQGRLWVIPAGRMKSGREQRVPLSAGAMAILEALPRDGELVFPGTREGRPLNNTATMMMLRRMGRGDFTVHGFRSTFRDWAAEVSHFPHEVAEMALAHAVGSKVELAYRRSDLFERRRQLAEEWSAFVTTPPSGEVVPLRRAGG
jgi:integrase